MDTWLKNKWTKVKDGTASILNIKTTKKSNSEKVVNLEEFEAEHANNTRSDEFLEVERIDDNQKNLLDDLESEFARINQVMLAHQIVREPENQLDLQRKRSSTFRGSITNQQEDSKSKDFTISGDQQLSEYIKQDYLIEENKEPQSIPGEQEQTPQGEEGQSQLNEELKEEQMDDELIQYVFEMIEMINTEDEEVNEQNMKLLVDQIADKLEEMHGKKPDKGMIQKFLDELRKTSLSDAKTAEEKKKMIQKMTESFYNLGYIGFYATSQTHCAAAAVQLGIQGGSLQTFSSGLGQAAWISTAFIYTAQTGLNYRRLKKGEIDKKEFWHRLRLNSVTSVSSMAVGSGGAAAGFALGTAIMPGIGSIVGAVVGGLAGGYAGEKLSANAYMSIEHKIEETKAKRKVEKREKFFKRLEEQCPVSHERFDESLHLLGIQSYKASLEEIDKAYFHMLSMINQAKKEEINSTLNSHQSDVQQQLKKREDEIKKKRLQDIMNGVIQSEAIYKEDQINEFLGLNEERSQQYQKKIDMVNAAHTDAHTYISHYGFKRIQGQRCDDDDAENKSEESKEEEQ